MSNAYPTPHALSKRSTTWARHTNRLAEVLAKLKTAKGGERSDDANRDAKHVTSLMMVENLSDDTVRFFYTKNEILDSEDVRFLQNLEHLYQGIVMKGKPKLLPRAVL
ncbi:hypothetical protein LMH87_005230 [Akanthomyces muscarius]|uniref:Uncharacterized protein n=1 Tax=Akanthomyces muscarius TaxID=2231603 RepID=A0A9W8URS3_AKAMU|nr:hypothetical protein LMH87_005230 [Akanthomyces muscarius]KAJ4163508.1 hypothetical protein LMH87_005230 [Akanthomyces muscarius]